MSEKSHIYRGIWVEMLDDGSTRQYLTVTDNIAFVLVTVLTTVIPLAFKSLWYVVAALIWRGLPEELTNRPGVGKFDVAGYTHVIAHFPGFIFRRSKRAKTGWATFRLAVIWVLAVLSFAASMGLPIWLAIELTGNEEMPIVRSSGTLHNAVLHKSFFKEINETTLREEGTYIERMLNITSAAAEYYQACYAVTTTVGCQSNLVTPRLEWEESEVSCPFSADVCRPNMGGYRLETGLIGMHELGFNTDSKVRFRKAVECGILSPDSFEVDADDADEDDTAHSVQEGDQFLKLRDTDAISFDVHVFATSGRLRGYRLVTVPHTPSWPLVPSLRRPDGDVTVIVLQDHMVQYIDPVVDPMFEAKQPRRSGNGNEWFLADNVFTMAACVDQYQVCIDEPGHAHACDGAVEWKTQANATLHDDWPDGSDGWVVLTALQLVTQQTGMEHVILERGAGALQAQRTVIDSTQTSTTMDRNAWHDEMRAWFGTSLAKMQLNVLSIAHPTSFLDSSEFIDITQVAEGLVDFETDAGQQYTDLGLPELTDKLTSFYERVLSREPEFTNLRFKGFIGTFAAAAGVFVLSEIVMVFMGISSWWIRKSRDGSQGLHSRKWGGTWSNGGGENKGGNGDPTVVEVVNQPFLAKGSGYAGGHHQFGHHQFGHHGGPEIRR